jgi:2-iminobutanoate/2-iminopropanoate deaminase
VADVHKPDRHLIVNPAGNAAPVGLYSHGIVTPAGGRWLHISGQVGMRPNGAMAVSFGEQAVQAWDNLVMVLKEAGMDVKDIVKLCTFVTDVANLPALGPVRISFLGAHRPASTLLVVAALARPEWLVEIEAVAHCA